MGSETHDCQMHCELYCYCGRFCMLRTCMCIQQQHTTQAVTLYLCTFVGTSPAHAAPRAVDWDRFPATESALLAKDPPKLSLLPREVLFISSNVSVVLSRHRCTLVCAL